MSCRTDRVAVTDGSRGFQPTVSSCHDVFIVIHRVATMEPGHYVYDTPMVDQVPVSLRDTALVLGDGSR